MSSRSRKRNWDFNAATRDATAQFLRQLEGMEGIAGELAMAEMNDYEKAHPCDCQDPALHQDRCQYATLDDCEWTGVKDALTDAIEAVEAIIEKGQSDVKSTE